MDINLEDSGPTIMVLSTESTEPMDAESQAEVSVVQAPELNLHIDGQLFTVKKDVLCKHSDYFRAMFSGKFVEQNKQDIAIDVVDATSMDIILRYLEKGIIDLSEYTLPVIGNLTIAVSFFQINELNKEIESALDSLINLSNWMDIMIIAENASYNSLERHAASFGLIEFKQVKPEIIPNMNKLFWYLSNPYLKTDSEAEVFRFGYNWVLQSETLYACTDVLLVIFGCLDMSRVVLDDVKEISLLISGCNSIATTLVECMKFILEHQPRISIPDQFEHVKKSICKMYKEHIYDEVCALAANSVSRENLLRPIVPLWKVKKIGTLSYAPRNISLFSVDSNGQGFIEYMKVVDKDLRGWSIAPWGATKFIQVCGKGYEEARRFMKDIKVYDTLRKTWSSYGEMLPSRRHAGVVVNGNLLFIIGGVDNFRRTRDTTIIYDLNARTYREGAKFPGKMRYESPAVCTYNDTVYAAGDNKQIYKYELDTTDKWIPVVAVDVNVDRMIAFKEHIYCSQSFKKNLYRFRPGVDKSLEMVKMCSDPPAAFINVDSSMLIFTRPADNRIRKIVVEMLSRPCLHSEQLCTALCGPKVVYTQRRAPLVICDYSGAFSLIIDMPRDIKRPISEFHQRYLDLYAKTTYGCTNH